MRDELNARDVIIARLEAEPNNLIPGLKENNDAIANLELKLIGVITELKDQENLITELGDELSKANLKLEAKDRAITAIKSGLAVKGGDKQLPLFPMEPTERVFTIPVENPTQTPEQTQTPEPVTISPVTEPTPTPTPSPEIIKPESTPQPEPNPEPTDTTGTLTRGELVKYIHSNFPGATITGQNIGDCYSFDKKGRLKSSRMPEFEATYGFKYLGKIDGVNRFQPIPKP